MTDLSCGTLLLNNPVRKGLFCFLNEQGAFQANDVFTRF